MATPNQIRANRANALRSTGPKTPEGKKVCAQNSTRHSMLSQTVVLEGESHSRFEDLLSSLTAQLKPRSTAEAAIIETMAIARWKQMRIWGIQKAGFDLEMARLKSSCTIPAARASIVFKSLADNSRVLDLQHRYETGYDRQFCRAYAFFLKLREKPDTQLEDTDFCAMEFSSATATWESAADPAGDLDDSTGDGKEVQEENQNQLPSEATQTMAVASPQHVLRNGPNSSPFVLRKTQPPFRKTTPPTRNQ